jgi:hypothetical protein
VTRVVERHRWVVVGLLLACGVKVADVRIGWVWERGWGVTEEEEEEDEEEEEEEGDG